jgi:hypothetical protein
MKNISVVKMLAYLFLLISFFVLFSVGKSFSKELNVEEFKNIDNIYGVWKIVNYKKPFGVASNTISEKEAKNKIGNIISFGKDCFIKDGEKVLFSNKKFVEEKGIVNFLNRHGNSIISKKSFKNNMVFYSWEFEYDYGSSSPLIFSIDLYSTNNDTDFVCISDESWYYVLNKIK